MTTDISSYIYKLTDFLYTASLPKLGEFFVMCSSSL